MKAERWDEQEAEYIKPGNEVYRIRKTASVDPVRRISLWLLLPFLLLLILSGYLVYKSFGTETSGQTDYTVDGGIDYLVALQENDYYSTEYLAAGQQYIASLIKVIDVDFSYNLATDEDVAVEYSYEIIATATATDKSDKSKVLYEKSEILKTAPLQTLTTEEIAIYEPVEVDYNVYNDLMHSFRQDFGISANCFLDLQLVVTLNGDIEAEDALNLSIPLTDQTVDITMDTKAVSRTGTIGEAVTDFYVENWSLLITSGVIMTASVLAMGIVIFLYHTRYGNNWYEATKAKILKNYDTRIVTVENTFFEPEDTVRTPTFFELLDAADNESAPILFCEVVPGEKSYFVVTGANTTYRYTLSQAYQQELQGTGQGKEL